MFRKIKTDIQSIPQAAWWIIASIVLYAFGAGFFESYFSLYLHQFFRGYGKVGLYLSVFTAVSAILAVPVGYLVDRTYYRTVLVIGRLLAALAFLLYFIAGATADHTILVIGLLIQGFAFPFVWTGTESSLRFATGKKGSTILFGLYGTATALAGVSGLLLSVNFFIERYPVYVLFLPASVFVLASITPIVRIYREIGHVSIAAALTEWIRDHQLGRHFFSDIREFNSEMWMMLFVGFFDKFLQVAVVAFVPLYLIDTASMSLTTIGLFAALLHLPPLLSFFFAEIARRGERLLYVSGGLLVAAGAAYGISLAAAAGLAAIVGAVLLAILGLVIASPSISGTITNLTPKGDFGTVTALQTLLRRLGSTIAPIVVGYSMDAVGFENTFVWIGALTAVLAISILVMRFVWARANVLVQINQPREHEAPYYL